MVPEGALGGPAVVLKFTAPWCGPCKRIQPAFLEALGSAKVVVGIEVDVDENPMGLCEKYAIKSMPTFVFLAFGEERSRLEGPAASALAAEIAALSLKAATSAGRADEGGGTPLIPPPTPDSSGVGIPHPVGIHYIPQKPQRETQANAKASLPPCEPLASRG
jgi:thioredoxin 1